MRNRATTLGLCLLLAGLSIPANAQPGTDETADVEQTTEEAEGTDESTEPELSSDSAAVGDESSEEEGDEDEEEAPLRLAPPTADLDPSHIDTAPDSDDEDVDPLDEALTDDTVDLLAESEPPSSDPTIALPTTPQPIFGLHGYFRTRGEVYDNFFLGHDGLVNPGTGLREPGREEAVFRYFRPGDRGVVPEGGCGDGPDSACDSSSLAFANMRLRLAPTLSLSDDVQVHFMIDAFDNLVLGSTPESEVYIPPGGPGGSGDRFTRPVRTPGAPLDSFVTTQNPPQALRNSARDSLYVRRAWASVRNRDLGQLRFGRMGSQWGLGILANSGDGIDADFSSDVDRIMAITKLFGVYIIAAYDFAAQGIQQSLVNDLRGVPFDATNKDDVSQYVFALARREDEQAANERLANGDWVLEGGAYYVYRAQFLSSAGTVNPFGNTTRFVRRNAEAHIPDLWARFRMGGLRLELEMAAIIGSIENIENDSYEASNYDIRQFGLAFEGEYRLMDNRLAIRLYTGYATGDPDVDGLSARDGLRPQRTDDRTLSNFAFHPNYRIDLILWRNILERVSGAWYLRPGVSYDIIRSPYGRLFGASFDMIYSRAAQEVQTYGSDPNLGVELDFSLYYRSEDGPEIFDGFYAMAQYGVLFPLGGLGYSPTVENAPDIGTAQALRLVLGVQY